MTDFYKMDPADWDNGTARLSLEEEAAYLRIVNSIHKHKGPVPDVDRVLAGMFRTSTRKARSLISALVEAGKIVVENGEIWNDRARSDLVHRGFVSVSRAESGAKGGRKSAESRAKTLENIDTEQAIASPREEKRREEKREAKASLRETPSRFDEFWATYPHRGGAKKGRKASQAKYEAAVKRGVLEQDIIAGAERYGGDRGVIDGYAKDPATWLNGAGWQDDIETKGPMVQTQGGRNDGNSKGEQRMRAFLEGARGSPGMDRGPDIDPSRPLLARG